MVFWDQPEMLSRLRQGLSNRNFELNVFPDLREI